MRTRIESNILTLVTDIPAATVARGIADLTAYDDKQNPVYAVKVLFNDFFLLLLDSVYSLLFNKSSKKFFKLFFILLF